MADRERNEGGAGGRGQDESSTRGASKRGEGFGDDQGTRVGSPTPGESERARPSTRPVDEGLEGSVLDDEEGGGGRSANSATGAGAEGARGIHEAGSGDETARAGGPTGDEPGETSRAGSEPLRGRQREHVSGYGGAADRPKKSSDQREPLDPDGGAEIE